MQLDERHADRGVLKIDQSGRQLDRSPIVVDWAQPLKAARVTGVSLGV